jgi:hypothetical protein
MVATILLLVAGCGGSVPSASTIPLPAVVSIPAHCRFFGGGGFVVLRGNADDPSVTWQTAIDGAGRLEIVWPPGYQARFTPDLEVLDPYGEVIARDGDQVPAGGCAVGPANDPSSVVLVKPQMWGP